MSTVGDGLCLEEAGHWVCGLGLHLFPGSSLSLSLSLSVSVSLSLLSGCQDLGFSPPKPFCHRFQSHLTPRTVESANLCLPHCWEVAHERRAAGTLLDSQQPCDKGSI